MFEVTPEMIAQASAETERLSRELDITNADHIALWLEANGREPVTNPLAYIACRIADAHEAELATLRAQKVLLAEQLKWYADQMCEGWCDKDPAACAAIGPENCAGCPARNALAQVAS